MDGLLLILIIVIASTCYRCSLERFCVVICSMSISNYFPGFGSFKAMPAAVSSATSRNALTILQWHNHRVDRDDTVE